MELADFIEAALSEIAEGVHRAKANTRDITAIVPGRLNREILTEKTLVKFDIAVSAEENSSSQKAGKAGAKFGINVLGSNIEAGLGGEAGTESAESRSTVSRISFEVPVYLNAHFRDDPASDKEAQYIRSREKS
jgi:hypothetical protein